MAYNNYHMHPQIYGPSQQRETKEKHCPIIFREKKESECSSKSPYFSSQVFYFLQYHHQLCQLFGCPLSALFTLPSSQSNLPAEFVHFNTAASHTSWVSKELCFINHNDPVYLESTSCETEIRKNTIMTILSHQGNRDD